MKIRGTYVTREAPNTSSDLGVWGALALKDLGHERDARSAVKIRGTYVTREAPNTSSDLGGLAAWR